ncbi:hypothetical protein [Arcticibacter svalbardensis]|nr:hypothetical protein [Arcticibacter svalbardensis]
MKKSITFLFATLPVMAFAQDGGYTAGPVIGILIGLALCVGLFLVLRSLMLWYWKIDSIVRNQEMTNEILKSISKSIEEGNKINKQTLNATPKPADDPRWDFTK